MVLYNHGGGKTSIKNEKLNVIKKEIFNHEKVCINHRNSSRKSCKEKTAACTACDLLKNTTPIRRTIDFQMQVPGQKSGDLLRLYKNRSPGTGERTCSDSAVRSGCHFPINTQTRWYTGHNMPNFDQISLNSFCAWLRCRRNNRKGISTEQQGSRCDRTHGGQVSEKSLPG